MSDTTIDRRFLESFDRRLERVFAALEEGLDVAPAELYGLEGFMAAGLELAVVDESTLREHLLACARRHFDGEVVERYRNDPTLMLHMRMRRAPVYPST